MPYSSDRDGPSLFAETYLTETRRFRAETLHHVRQIAFAVRVLVLVVQQFFLLAAVILTAR
jgi:hypothetical protein